MNLSWISKQYSKVMPSGAPHTRLAVGTVWSMVSVVLAQGSLLLSGILVARLLGKSGYGEYGILMSTVVSLGVFAGMGLGVTVTKHVAEFRVSNPSRISNVLALTTRLVLLTGGLISIVLFVMADWVATQLLNAPNLAAPLRWGSVLILLNESNGVQIGALAGFEAFKKTAKLNIVRAIATLTLIVAGAWFDGVRGATIATVLVSCIAWCINHGALQQTCKENGVAMKNGQWRDELPLLWKFSLPALLAGIVVAPAMWIGNAALANAPHGYEELGVFNAANQWRNIILFIPTVMGSAMMPILSSLLARQNKQDATRLHLRGVIINGTLVGLLSLVLTLTSSWIMHAYGGDFATHTSTFIWLVWAVALLAISNSVSSMLIASNKLWIGFFMNAGWGVLFLGLVLLIFRNGWGATGLSIAYFVSYMMLCLWTVLYALYTIRRGTYDGTQRLIAVGRDDGK